MRNHWKRMLSLALAALLICALAVPAAAATETATVGTYKWITLTRDSNGDVDSTWIMGGELPPGM